MATMRLLSLIEKQQIGMADNFDKVKNTISELSTGMFDIFREILKRQSDMQDRLSSMKDDCGCSDEDGFQIHGDDLKPDEKTRIAAIIKDMPKFLSADSSIKKCEVLIAEIQKYGENYE